MIHHFDEIKEHLDVASELYNFLKKSAVLESYEGATLKRLKETRWPVHLESTRHIKKTWKPSSSS